MFALDYGGEGGSYASNVALYNSAGWQVLREESWSQVFNAVAEASPSLRILIDISSMPRAVLASLVEAVATPRPSRDVTFVYAPGDFEQSEKAAGRAEVLSAEPISPFFAGELRPTSIPVGLVIGLGLEQYRALGVIELLEPAHTWIFTTYSGDERYREAAEAVHRRLLETFDPGAVFEYDLRSIADTYASLESLTFSTGLRYRLIMAPSGPKVFTLACLLVGSSRDPARPAIWRVGNASPSEPFDVDEVGDLVAARVVF